MEGVTLNKIYEGIENLTEVMMEMKAQMVTREELKEELAATEARLGRKIDAKIDTLTGILVEKEVITPVDASRVAVAGL